MMKTVELKRAISVLWKGSESVGKDGFSKRLQKA
jgi:hypothetical protein